MKKAAPATVELEMAEESDDPDSDEDDQEDRTPRKPVGKVFKSSIAVGSTAKASSVAKAAAKYRAGRTSGAKRKAERSPSPQSVSAAVGLTSGTDAELMAKLDSEMQRVQKKLGPPFNACLFGLEVSRHMNGEKLGVRLVAVWGSKPSVFIRVGGIVPGL